MTLKSKLSALIVSFLLLMAALSVGSFLIFNRLNDSFDVIRESVTSHNLNEDLKTSISEFITNVEGWAVSGEPKYKNVYKEKLGNIYKNFGSFTEKTPNKALIDAIGKDFGELKNLADQVIAAEQPVGNKNIIPVLKKMEETEQTLLARIQILHSGSIKAVVSAAEKSDLIKDRMAFYLTFLFLLSSIAFLFLAVFMKKMIAVPFNDILTATDRITSGDLNYRIESGRKDEFGIIADRFDNMVGKLQEINLKNEELYLSTRERLDRLTAMTEIARAINSTLNINELLDMIVENAARLLHAKGCILRLLEADKLTVKTSYGLPKTDEGMLTLAIGEGLPGKVALEGKPIIVDDLSKMPQDWKIPHLDARSVMNVPMKAGGTIIGTLGLYDKMSASHKVISFSEDDLNTVEGFASLSAIAINKAQLFDLELRRERDAVEARKRLDVLFDSVQGGIITLGRDYKILLASKFLQRWVSINVGEIVGKNCLEVFHEVKGICPHCIAQTTFETGQITGISQIMGANFAELTSYPIKDPSGKVIECVVFVQDITNRVLQQEEMLSLYKEVAQTKDLLESLIENSADAIVTSDLNGTITAWNHGAEKIYGFTETEVIGRYLPFVPDYLKETEDLNVERVKNGEVLRALETVRQKKDGAIIEISLTLSPIKNAAGEIIGISGISRDISEKKNVEKELIRKNQELSRLFFISSAMKNTLELDRLLRMVLTAVTMGDGLGFNRAVLFLVDKEKNILKGSMSVGPASQEEAGRIWDRLYHEKQTLEDVMRDLETKPITDESFLDRLSRGIEIPLDTDSTLTRAVRERRPYNIPDARNEPLADIVLIQQLGTEAYAVIPLIARGHVIGALWVDNLFNKRRITEEDMSFITTFSSQLASAIENAKLFEQISFAEAELENIFSSITDMVYITDLDCIIRNVNRSVVEKFGVPKEKIIGEKCYKFFHGVNEPWFNCPHTKVLATKKSYMEEHDDPYLGGTFLTSCSPILDAAGNIFGTVHIVRDITELKNIRERLVSAERMAALGEVAAKVAHEIRNPLVSVGGFAMRLEKKLDGSLKEYASIINTEVKTLESKLKDILGFVRETRLSKTDTNINDLLNGIIQLLDSDAKERNIVIETKFGEIAGVSIDPDRIREAFMNILTNAIQAIVSSGNISVTTYMSKDFVVAEIRDTGTGIDEKDIPFIFDPFYTTKTYGTGLGLAITHRIIEEHHGKIEVESKPGEGTVMKVYLPNEKEGV